MAISVVDVGSRYGGYSVRRDGAATFPEKPLLFVDDSVSVPRRNLEDNAVAGNGAVAEAVFLVLLVAWTLLYVLLPDRALLYYENFSVCFIDSSRGRDFMGQLGMTLFIALPVLVTFLLHLHLCCLAAHHASRVDAIRIGDILDTAVDASFTEGEAECGQDEADAAAAAAAAGSPGPERRRPRVASGSRPPPPPQPRRATPETKAARTFLIMALVTAVSWTPYYVTISWENFRQEPAPDAVAYLSQLCLLLNSLWNVIIYYARNQAFRSTANRLLGCLAVRTRARSPGNVLV